MFGAETADLEREGKKHEPAGEGTYTRNKTYVERQEKYPETKPAKAPEELFETETVQKQQFQRTGQEERRQSVGGFSLVHAIFSQHLVEEELTASDVERGGGQVSEHLVEEELTASNEEGGPNPGDRGQVSQHLLEEELTASDVERGPDPGGG